MSTSVRVRVLAAPAALLLAWAALVLPVEWAAAQSPETCGESRHPSGKDRCAEHGGSGTQGSASSDPDDDTRGPERTNGGEDQPGGPGGANRQDQDGNNGCGNDQDFEDDNEGLCGDQPATAGQGAKVQQQEGGKKEKDRPARSSKLDKDGEDGASTTITADDPGRGPGRADRDAEQATTGSAAREDGEAADVSGTKPAPGSRGQGQAVAAPLDAADAAVGFGSHGLAAGPRTPSQGGAIATGASQAVAQAGSAAAGAAEPQLPATGTAALTQLLLGMGSLALGTVTLRRTRAGGPAPWLCCDATES